MKFRDLIDHNTSKMGKAMFGISNANSAINYNKIIGNKSAMRSAIGRKGGYTASLILRYICDAYDFESHINSLF